MMGDKIGIGIIGAGSQGATHAGACHAIAEAHIVGIWSRSFIHAEALARVSGAVAASDLRELLEDSRIDLIQVCTATHTHSPFVTAALAAGKHVLCETPLAIAREEAEEMIAAARKAKRSLFVGLLMRSVSDYVYLRDQVRRREFGELRSLHLWRLGSYLRAGAGDAKSHYGDPATELMMFDFDVLNWIWGRPVSLTAGPAMIDPAPAEEITALLRYPSGGSAVVTGSGIMPPSYPYTVGYRAVFERGVLEHEAVFEGDIPSSKLLLLADGRIAAPLRLHRANPFETQLRHCIDCIRRRVDSDLLNAENALAALGLSLATQASLREGRTVVF
jgi:UDP-N-acetylglucosamine 3-dehydrogenase